MIETLHNTSPNLVNYPFGLFYLVYCFHDFVIIIIHYINEILEFEGSLYFVSNRFNHNNHYYYLLIILIII